MGTEVYVFVGNEAAEWHDSAFATACTAIRAAGGAGVAPKRADGANRWYSAGDEERWAALAAEHGLVYLPWQYSYGPALGADQVAIEAAIARELDQAASSLLGAGLDCEVEYNGRPDAMTALAAAVGTGPRWLTTWSDPAWQDWQSVLARVPARWTLVPQAYSGPLWRGLAAEPSLAGRRIQPAVTRQTVLDLGRGVGYPPVVWLWEYGELGEELAGVVHTIWDLPATAANSPAPEIWYTVRDLDSLAAIADRYHVTLSAIQAANLERLDATARAHGLASSDGGSWIWPGESLLIPPQ